MTEDTEKTALTNLEETEQGDPAKWPIRKLLGRMTIPAIAGSISTLVALVVVSFSFGHYVATTFKDPKHTAATPPKQKVRVVFVDTKNRPYMSKYPTQYPEGNTDFLIHHIELNSNLNGLINPVKKLTEPPPGADPSTYRLSAAEVEKAEPDLIVIHRSAFYGEQEDDPNEAKLVEFLKGMRKLDTLFVLYSRKQDTNSWYAADLENKTSLGSRIYPYLFKDGLPFDDRAQVDHFFNTILLLAQARMNQKVQSLPN